MHRLHAAACWVALMLAAIVPARAGAQLYEPTLDYFGITGGVLSSGLTGEFIEESDGRYFALFGLSWTNPMNTRVALRVETNLTQQRSSSSTYDDLGLDLDLATLEVPAVITGVVPVGPLALQGHAGLSLAFPIRCRAGVRGGGALGGEPETSCPDSSLDLEPTPVQVGLPVGAAVAISMGPGEGTLLFEARYTFGMNDVFKDPTPEVNQRSWSFVARAIVPNLGGGS